MCVYIYMCVCIYIYINATLKSITFLVFKLKIRNVI